MISKILRLYEFDSYTLNPNERTFTKSGELIHLSPRAFDLLVLLVENNGRLVEKQDLIEQIWKEQFVEEANIQVQISAIRKALQDKDNGKYIETVPKRGYRFNSKVKVSEIRKSSEEPEQLLIAEKQTRAPDSSKDIRPTRNWLLAVLAMAVFVAGIGLIFFAFLKQAPLKTNFAGFSQSVKLKN